MMMKLTISFLILALQLLASHKGVLASSLLENQELRALQERLLEDYNYYNDDGGGNNDDGSNAYGSSNAINAYGSNFFADSQATYYNGYQQAWRYLGHLVKCGYPSSRYYQQQSHDSGDNYKYVGNNYCQRYLVWAAYVDFNYQGGGIGEYFYYDPYNEGWDYTACQTHGGNRCAPMDCHMSNTTTWTLMGVYKEAEYFGDDAFFEQLFKHEGYCLWNDYDLYEFMSDAREQAWPEGCVQSYTSLADDSGNEVYLYIDLKPTLNGNMSYGLYVDEICKTEYTGNQIDVDDVASNMGLLYGSYLDAWNNALEVYKVCQPCMAYNLQVTSSYNNYNNNYYGGRRLDDYYDPNNGYFQCDDDADYTNVNQCMKFRSHADLEVATWEDLVIATEQGGILDVNIGGTIFGTEKMTYEQQLYLEQLQLAKEREEEEEYQRLLASVPSAVPMLMFGGICLSLGTLSLLTVGFRVYQKRKQQQPLEEAFSYKAAAI